MYVSESPLLFWIPKSLNVTWESGLANSLRCVEAGSAAQMHQSVPSATAMLTAAAQLRTMRRVTFPAPRFSIRTFDEVRMPDRTALRCTYCRIRSARYRHVGAVLP